jgi:MFS-type transporter involved in bile tolerance (Atg22 family)
MNLMLAVMVVCVAVGLLAKNFESRTYLVIGGIATTMAGLYYFTTRFMT